jgi:Flp pilus assembly protein TadG
MASKLRRLLGREDGQALVELSLTAGFLCLMLLAVWQVGTVFSNFIDLSEAARDGARAAALSGAPTTLGDSTSFNDAKTEGIFAATNSASVPGMAVSITAEPSGLSGWTAGSKVRATVSAPYSLSLFGVAITTGTMSVTDDMRVHRKGV